MEKEEEVHTDSESSTLEGTTTTTTMTTSSDFSNIGEETEHPENMQTDSPSIEEDSSMQLDSPLPSKNIEERKGTEEIETKENETKESENNNNLDDTSLQIARLLRNGFNNELSDLTTQSPLPSSGARRKIPPHSKPEKKERKISRPNNDNQKQKKKKIPNLFAYQNEIARQAARLSRSRRERGLIEDDTTYDNIDFTSLMNTDLLSILLEANENMTSKDFESGQFTVQSLAFAGRTDLEEGNKIILPQAVLQSITSMNTGPLIFQLKNTALGIDSPITYCSVIEFTAPTKIAILPDWIMDKLSLSVDQTVTLTRYQSLPLGTYVRFQPLRSDFVQLQNPKAVLESWLSYHYSTLTTGEIISIKQGDQIFQLKVSECRPADSIKIHETSLKVEFDEAIEQIKDEIIRVKLGDEISDEVKANEFKYYLLLLDALNIHSDILLTVSPINEEGTENGDPDLYIDQKMKPNKLEHSWISANKGEDEIILMESDPKRNPSLGVFYIGVYGHKKNAKFNLKITKIEDEPTETNNMEVDKEKESQGMKLGDMKSSGDDENKGKEGFQECNNCKKWIPELNFLRHDAFCQRSNWRCPVDNCGMIINVSDKDKHFHCPQCDGAAVDKSEHCHCRFCAAPFDSKDDAEKHVEVAHTKLSCVCGMELEREDMLVHKQFECPKRSVECKYCQRHISFDQLIYHKEECGATTVICEFCPKRVTLKNIEIHYAVEHKKIYRGKGAAPIETLLGGERAKEINATVAMNLDKSKNKEVKNDNVVEEKNSGRSIRTSGYACPQCGLLMSSFEEVSTHMLTSCIANQMDM